MMATFRKDALSFSSHFDTTSLAHCDIAMGKRHTTPSLLSNSSAQCKAAPTETQADYFETNIEDVTVENLSLILQDRRRLLVGANEALAAPWTGTMQVFPADAGSDGKLAATAAAYLGRVDEVDSQIG